MSNSSLRGASQLFTFRVMEAGRGGLKKETRSGGGGKKGNSFGWVSTFSE